MITAVLPHPGHGRLVEKAMMMVSYVICFKECLYTLSWHAGDVAYYQPAHGEPVTEGCGCGIKSRIDSPRDTVASKYNCLRQICHVFILWPFTVSSVSLW